MSAHTPGPWKVEDSQIDPISGGPFFHMIIGPDDNVLASTWSRGHIPNARLIAAAPTLLAALKKIKTMIEDEGVDFDCAYPEASAAIAAAETPC